MPNFTLTEKQYHDLKEILMSDNCDLAKNPNFLKKHLLIRRRILTQRDISMKGLTYAKRLELIFGNQRVHFLNHTTYGG
jgi:hypothetical protein